MLKVNNTFFRDLNADENLKAGIAVPYAGIVTERATELYNEDGKDYLVEYIDAWGNVVTGWRAADDVELIMVTDSDWTLLRTAIDKLNNK